MPLLADLVTVRDNAPYVQLYLDTLFGENVGGAMNDAIALMFAGHVERHTTLVLVTHDAALAARCNRVVRLRSGRIDCEHAREAAPA